MRLLYAIAPADTPPVSAWCIIPSTSDKPIMPHSNPLEHELEDCLKSVARQRGELLAATLRPILIANLERGRIDHYLNGHAQAQLPDYVWRVADHFDRLSPYIDQVQKTKSEDVWEPLFSTLCAWAYRIMSRTPASSGDVEQISLECAAAAAARMLTAHFPYDTEFDPWAFVLLRNVCREYLRRETRAPLSIHDESISTLPDLTHIDRERLRGLRLDLLDAVQRLSSEARRQFVVRYYFQGYSLTEVARQLGRSMSAIYKLHFDALIELRKIWNGKEHKDE